ncbi:hypothetical protein C8Q77DRAFT_1073085 [Trametes polyzona]|nr:hypothetical protein C8Q77DRAFT_1073085 [Trametes polyzona]
MALWHEVPLCEFLERFLPGEDLPGDFQVPDPVVEVTKKERHMYPGLCEFFNAVLKQTPHNELTAFSCDTYPEAVAPEAHLEGVYRSVKTRPDIAFYSSLEPAKRAYEVVKKPTRKGKKASRARAPDASTDPASTLESSLASDLRLAEPSRSLETTLLVRTAWAWAELIVEVKKDPSRTSFSFMKTKANVPLELSNGMEHSAARMQIVHYASEIFDRQHRTSVLVISIYTTYARFIRFDREGAVLSDAFDYTSDPRTLALFLYRFSRMTRVQRGHDTTATLATDEEQKTFYDLLGTLKPVPEPGSTIERGLRHAMTPGWPIYALHVDMLWSPAKDAFLDARAIRERTVHRCLVGRPIHTADSLVGRGTRTFVGYDLTEKTLLIIKDYWRTVSEDRPSESEIYQHLYEKLGRKRVLNHFPTLRGAGDVPLSSSSAGARSLDAATSVNHEHEQGRDQRPQPLTAIWQETLTQQLRPVGATTPPRRHCRLVVKEICRTLDEFTTPLELVYAIRSALIAHRVAWEAGVLHRDISPGNILLYDDPETKKVQVLLSDWDQARTREQLNRGIATQRVRSKPYELSDDLESFVHVLHWCTLRYLPHDLSGLEHATTLTKTFSEYFDNAPHTAHGNLKFANMRSGALLAAPKSSVAIPLTGLFDDLSRMCKEHYDTIDFAKLSGGSLPQPPLSRDLIALPGSEFFNVDELEKEYGWVEGGESLPRKKLQDQSPLRATEVKPSPLTDHTEILAVFRVAYHDKTWPTLKDYAKTRDQVPHLIYPTLSVAGRRKRELEEEHSETSEDSDDSDNEPPPKQAKRTHSGSREPSAGPSRRGRRGFSAVATNRQLLVASSQPDTPGSSLRPRSRPGSRPGSLPGSQPGSLPGSRPGSRTRTRLTPQLAGLGIDSSPVPSRPQTPNTGDDSALSGSGGKSSDRPGTKGQGKSKGKE